jgi:SAM-dependent methyltransferase
MRHAAGEPTPRTTGYDAELQRHNEVLRRAVDVQSHDHVLDIGCGAGQTTREAARTAWAGSAFGVDVSAPAIEHARELTRAEGLRNVAFQHADAQSYRFPPEHFDLAMSRFGTMFFADPVAAFTNIRRALRPAGRLVMMVWQTPERNEWDVLIRRSLEAPDGPAGASGGPDPFSLADPPTVREILQAAGFAEVTFTDVHEPVYYGPDVAAALDWVRGFTCTKEALRQLDPVATSRADDRLRQALAEHLTGDGVWLHSRAWIVTAHRPREGGPCWAHFMKRVGRW